MGARKEAKEVAEKFSVGGGAIRLSILGLLSKGERCGYEIAKELRETDEALDIQFGALYPLLEKLERKGLIEGRWEDGRGQKGRHVYGLTKTGKKSLASAHATWLRVMKSVRTLVGARA
ncbi:MAG: PadR family transcriptional regulator [Candidatus Hydrogenedentota bacterium]